MSFDTSLRMRRDKIWRHESGTRYKEIGSLQENKGRLFLCPRSYILEYEDSRVRVGRGFLTKDRL